MGVIKLWEGFGPAKEVQFTEGGEVFVLPPDLPAELYFSVMDLAERAERGEAITEVESFRAAYDQLLDLCRYRRPDLEHVPCTLSQLITGVAQIYGQAAQDEVERPPRPSRSGGATSSSPSKRTRPKR